MGHPQTLADLLYLQAVALWGQRSQAPSSYSQLAPLLERAVALDPTFEAAYLLAGTALTTEGMDTATGLALLKRGAQLLPNSWRLLFLYGFNAYDLQHDAAAAAEALAAAALLPGSPPFLPLVVARLSAEAHNPQVGIMLLQALLAQAVDAQQAESYEQRIAVLQSAQLKDQLQRHVDSYRARTGKPPASLRELVASGLIERIPENPTHKALTLSPQGKVEEAADDMRSP